MKRILLVMFTISLAAFILIVGTGTRGGLAYFSPQTLEYYTQSEFTILQGIPIWRSFAQPSEPAIIGVAVKNGWLKSQSTDPLRWDLVFHWNDAWRDGYSGTYDFLFKHDEAIISWMDKNPDLAAHYWQEGFGRFRSSDLKNRYVGERILNSLWHCNSTDEMDREIKRIEMEILR